MREIVIFSLKYGIQLRGAYLVDDFSRFDFSNEEAFEDLEGLFKGGKESILLECF